MERFLKSRNFVPQDGTLNEYRKVYENTAEIRILLSEDKILYDKKIVLGDATTSNTKNKENLIVLDCVDRLLSQGYKPEDIYLEKRWKSGRGTSGKADIVVYKNSIPFVIIECKKDIKEVNMEKSKMRKNGGQLFSYYNFERSVELLCLYTSSLEDKETFTSLIVPIKKHWRALNNQQELLEHWNKNFIKYGLFESESTPYLLNEVKLKEKDLLNLTNEDSSRIFNQFAEILRHNVISDKPNAFNKLLNMFVCKIIDEDRSKDDELLFQVNENESDEDLQIRLSDLYKSGMEQFLNIEVADTTNNELKKMLDNSLTDSIIIDRIFSVIEDLRLKKNPEFAFIEVYDEKSFEENAKVVREIVELLQPFRFRYNHKQQFLGNFFELLLNTSMKQESGQFFTPVPIAKFLTNSVPIEEIVKNKIEQNQRNILPYVIDYAAGSGHFLTEYMDHVQYLIDEDILDIHNSGKSVRKDISSYKTNPFIWAKEYVYGIEKDYRLVKTAKVSSFLNGDGDANIIRADGLDNFYQSKEYYGLLKSKYSNSMKLEKFDLLLANPPYSVNSFRNTVKHIDNSFELSKYLSDTSSEIECLFLERMSQLLRTGGFGAVILPVSILSNSGIALHARELLFNNFEIKSIVKLGPKTFMATGINTIILFVKKIENRSKYYKELINEIYETEKEMTINNIHLPLTKYLDHYYEGIALSDYFSMFKKQPTIKVKNTKMYNEYFVENDKTLELVKATEKMKLLYFIYSTNKNILFVDAKSKEDELKFLGYKFSNRRNNEGIHPIKKGSDIDSCTLLYPTEGSSKLSVSDYVRNYFISDTEIEVTDELTKYVKYTKLQDMLEFENADFNLKILLTEKINYQELWGTDELIYLRDIAIIEKGTSITSDQIEPGDVQVVAGGKQSPYSHKYSNRDKNTITCSASGANAGYLNFFKDPIFASDCCTIRSKNESIITTKSIYDTLLNIQEDIYKLQTGSAQPHVYSEDLKKIMIPKSFNK